jgi:hypothetical protein
LFQSLLFTLGSIASAAKLAIKAISRHRWKRDTQMLLKKHNRIHHVNQNKSTLAVVSFQQISKGFKVDKTTHFATSNAVLMLSSHCQFNNFDFK